MRAPPRWPPPLLCLGTCLLLLATVVPGTVAQRPGSCVLHTANGDPLEGTSIYLTGSPHNHKRLEDTTPNGADYYTFINTAHINEVTLKNYETWFKLEKREEDITILTGDDFENFEKDPNFLLTTFQLYIDFTCDDGVTVQITVLFDIYDSNNYPPEFTESHYEYNVVMPLARGFDFTALMPIAGFDYDITAQGKRVDAAITSGGEEANWFTVSGTAVQTKGFSVTFTNAIELRAKDPIVLTLEVTDGGTDDEPDVRLSEIVTITIIPDLDESLFNPRFDLPLYTATIKSSEEVSLQALLEQPITFEEGFAEELQYTLIDGGSHSGLLADNFIQYEVKDEEINLYWKTGVDDEQLEAFLKQPYALLVLTARNPSASLTGRTVIHLTLPGAFGECPIECPSTESPTDCPSTATSETPDSCDCPSTATPGEYPPTDCPLVCPSTEGPTECPSTEPSETPGSCQCSTTEVPDCSLCPSTICPSTEYSTECPPTQNPDTCQCTPTECPSSQSPIDCSTDCPQDCSGSGSSTDNSNEEPAPKPQLEFTQQSYHKELSLNAEVGEVVATPTLKEEVNGVVFSLSQGSASSPLSVLNIDSRTGVVTLAVAPPIHGISYYQVTATAGGETATAELLVIAPVVNVCEDGNMVFEYALYVVNVTENEPGPLIAGPGAKENCLFSIINSAETEYFSVDEVNGTVSVISVDRESPEFGGADYPVLRAHLRVSCSDAIQEEESVARGVVPFWEQVVEKVVYNPSEMVLVAVVQDVNDQIPIFKAAPSTVVGFPDADLAAQLHLPALYTAEATDADVGWHAELSYSLDSAGAVFLEVNPDTGALYPRSDVSAPEDGYNFEVRATDCRGVYGASGTNSGSLRVTLLTLSANHLVELRVKGVLPEETDEMLETVAGDSREMRVLSATVLTGSGDGGSSGSGDDDGDGSSETESRLPHSVRVRRDADVPVNTELRIVLYAVNNNARLEDANDMKGYLKEALQNEGYTVEAEVADLSNASNGKGGSSNSGLLAAVITLGVLLGIVLLAAGFVGFWFGVKPRLAKDKKQDTFGNRETNSSQRSVVPDFQPLSEDMIKPPLDNEAENGEAGVSGAVAPAATMVTLDPPTPTDTRPSMMLSMEESHEMESEDYETPRSPPVPEHTYEDLEAAEPAPRKSVFFNEDVDCIEIRM